MKPHFYAGMNWCMYLCMISPRCLDVLYIFAGACPFRLFDSYSKTLEKQNGGGEGEAVSCFRGRKPPSCHNNDFVLWSPVTYGFEYKQRWVKNYAMLLFCHCPVYISYTDCITEGWPFIHVSFVHFFFVFSMYV